MSANLSDTGYKAQSTLKDEIKGTLLTLQTAKDKFLTPQKQRQQSFVSVSFTSSQSAFRFHSGINCVRKVWGEISETSIIQIMLCVDQLKAIMSE